MPQGGQEKDPNKIPGEEPLKGGPRCSNCGCQLPNPAKVTNQRKGNLTNCPACNAPINMGGQWTNPFNQQKQQPFNRNLVVAPQLPRQAQILQPNLPTQQPVAQLPSVDINSPVVNENQEVLQQNIPQINPQQVMPNQTDRSMLSDENADNIDEGHLNNVQQSANALGL